MLSRRHFLAAAASAALAAQPKWLSGANTAIQGYSLEEAIALLRRLGFPVIEIHPFGKPDATPGVFPGFQFDQFRQASRARLREALRPFSMVTAHLPYAGWNWMSGDAAERAASVKAVDVALEGAAYFGSKMCVLHPQPLAGGAWQERRQQYYDAIGRWGDRAGALGMRIGLETGFPASISGFVEFVKGLNHAQVGATIDVGHQARYAELVARVPPDALAKPESIRAYNDTTIEIVNRLGPKVFHFHVHDIEPSTWAEHKPFVHGFVDYPRLFETLGRVGYRGVLILEIGGDPKQMPRYLEDARDHLRAWLS